ncbi:MAG TPA: response regulator transcription factor [Bacteroidota bacterium]|jgi:DNA-binding NarL/FixJ family response regulator|nr:response regulator transcription factor [Bacteroidota bacterium]
MKKKESRGNPLRGSSLPYRSPDPERAPIRVLLVDDHAVVREGFKLLLEREPGITVVGEAKTGEEGVRLAATFLPDVILMDIAMPDLNGLRSAHAILSRLPGMKIIILSMSDNDEFIWHSLQIGVQGYLLKENASQEVIKAVKEVVLNDNSYYAPAIQKKIVSFQKHRVVNLADHQRRADAALTPRELEVLQFVAEGKTNPEIAKLLLVSIKTVAKHRQQIMDKIGIHDATGLTRYAISKGIIRV